MGFTLFSFDSVYSSTYERFEEVPITSVCLTAKLMCRLWPQPWPYELITPWLSPWIRMEALVKPCSYRIQATSSTATPSAHPMSLPSVCHDEDHFPFIPDYNIYPPWFRCINQNTQILSFPTWSERMSKVHLCKFDWPLFEIFDHWGSWITWLMLVCEGRYESRKCTKIGSAVLMYNSDMGKSAKKTHGKFFLHSRWQVTG